MKRARVRTREKEREIAAFEAKRKIQRKWTIVVSKYLVISPQMCELVRPTSRLQESYPHLIRILEYT